MKTNHELLKIMLQNIDELLCTGMCGVARYELPQNKLCTNEEGMKLDRYIERNTPKEIIGTANHGWYWWERGEVEPRKKWLKKQIELTLKTR